MKAKGLAIGVIVAGIAAVLLLNRQPVQKVASVKSQPTAPPLVQPSTPPPPKAAPPVPNVEPTPPPVERKPAPLRVKTPIQPPTPQPSPQLVDPDARLALALVGEDPEAEAYWEEAIFDTNLPDKERDDLMEDLNEIGFNDPKNPSPNDLPLILNRLALIEELAPSTDEFMARHLGEAYKDLIEMADKASQGQ